MIAKWKRMSLLSALLAGSALVAPAAAQNETQAGDESSARRIIQGGEIVVTAQRREQRLRDVSASVSAFTSDDILSRGVTDLDSLQASIPGIRLVDIGPGSQRIQLRGIAQYQGLPTVGNYVDEFSINNRGPSGIAEIRLLDIERVEVLRGPQPTLYGEGSMGGTIRYITANPDLQDFGGNLLGEISRPKDGEIGWRTEGVINVPLAQDVAGLRIAAAREERAGWIDGVLGDDANDRDTTTVRGKLLFEPTDALRISVLGLYNESEQDVKSYSFDGENTAQTNPSIATQQYELGTLEVSYDFGPVTLLSVSGILSQEGRTVDDSTEFYQTLFGGPIIVDALSDSRGELQKWSQEIRLTSNGDGPFRYLIGTSYTNSEVDGVITADAVSLIPVPASAFGLVFTSDASLSSKIWAIFGNASYDFTDWLTIDFGGRYFRDKIDNSSVFALVDFLGPGMDAVTITGGEATFDSFNPRGGVTIKTGDSGIVYANAARGFRSGGFNGVMDPAVSPTFNPESLWTYEVGTKQSLLDGMVFVELAVYYNDYTDIQLNQVVNPTVATVINGGEASGPGVDFILQANPLDDLSLTTSVGWNNLRFDTTSVDKLEGDPADLVPDWSFSASIDYTPQITNDVQLITHFDIGYISEAQITLRSIAALGFNAVTPNDARTIANGRIGVALEHVEAYIFMNNLFDESGVINPAFGAFFEPTFTQPRTIGFGVRARF